MKLNLVAVNIGNTNVQIGLFEDSELVESILVRASDEEATRVSLTQAWERVQARGDGAVVVGSVNPKVCDALMSWADNHLGTTPLRVEKDLKIPIGRQLDPESIVGEDRLLNAAAAFDRLKQACVIIDAGTAVTVDFVDGVGTFHGGAIAPGARMMLRALKQQTALLPEIEFSRPDEPIGHNTVQAMLSGTFHGIRGMARELVEQYAMTAGVYPLVLATGGDAQVLFEDCDVVERVVPDLTLHGLLVTARVHAEAEDAED